MMPPSRRAERAAAGGSPPPPVPLSLREGHRGLVEAFREFARDVEGSEDGLPHPDVLRAVIAFLRQGVLPFAQWEEEHLDGCFQVSEDTAFEHAFLNAEIDALAAALSDLHRPADRRQAEQRVRKCVHRIEAVLELHVQKAEDRETPPAAPVADPQGSPRPETGGVQPMDLAEIQRALLRNQWGVLCTVALGVPYGVPVSYGYDGRNLYLASGPGRKRRNMEAAAAVCLTVAEVKDGDQWSSVVVTGHALPVSGMREKLHALDTIRRQRAAAGTPSAADLARIARASIFRIRPDEITGRTRG